MDSSNEILRVTAAIVSAFQTAADTLELVKDRKEKKKRKRERDVEELMEMKILHKSLIEGGMRCRKHCENRHKQFSPAFEAGDSIAILALKDVVISLQTEVIQALHIARAVENAVLDFTTLHESSITNRKDATRAMDQLCQRIMASMQFQPQNTGSTLGGFEQSGASIRSSFQSMHISDVNESYDMPPSPPPSVGNPRQSDYQRAISQRSLTIRRPDSETSRRGRYNALQSLPLGWISSKISHASHDLSVANETSSMAGGNEQSSHNLKHASTDELSPSSIQCPLAKSEKDSIHLPATDATPTTIIPQQPPDPPPKDVPLSEQFQQPTGHLIISADTSAAIISGPQGGRHVINIDEKSVDMGLVRPPGAPRSETTDTVQRAHEAPEVVSADFEGKHVMSPVPDLASDKYPAFPSESDFAERLLSLPAGLDNIWSPLTRPAMHNRYHGFCKGAWQMRKAVHEGLNLQLTTDLKEPIIHWTCKECKFRWKAPNIDTLPDYILYNQKYSIRYRWLFLAKSHRVAENSCDTLENYKYGCILCAAQGQATAVYDRLDHLLVHIISKHKSTMLTPELKQKTKCIVGGMPVGDDNWDINIPQSPQKKGAGVAADEFFISASKFFNKRKGRR